MGKFLLEQRIFSVRSPQFPHPPMLGESWGRGRRDVPAVTVSGMAGGTNLI